MISLSQRLRTPLPISFTLPRLDPFWWRLAVFFICCWVGHYVGAASYTAGASFGRFLQQGFSGSYGVDRPGLLFLPVDWFLALVAGCALPWGMIQLCILGGALLIVRLSDDRYYHGFAIVLLCQPLHSLYVSLLSDDPLDAADCVFTAIVLITWETGIGVLYWWYYRRMRSLSA